MNMKKLLLAALMGGLVAIAPKPAEAAINALSVIKVVKTGVANSTTAGTVATDSFTFTNDGRTFLHFSKTQANACTVTVTAQATVQGLAVANLTFTVPATTGDVYAGPFPPSIFNDSSGNVTFTTSEESGLTFSALRLGQ